jgi:alpha-tubulin suppressor-like RCC1 family protein
MRIVSWKFMVLAFVLWQAGSTAPRAQFLGQQSLSQSSYVIDQSGQLWAWGDNFYGQLGVGDRVNRNTPTLVPVPAGASKWVLVAGGANFAIAVADSDKLYAWGLNDKGQIGIGIEGGDLYGAPTRIPNPPYVTTWKWVSAGAAHCEALTTDGRLFAWGDNQQGELGVGTTQYLFSPQPVQFPTGVTAWEDVAAGPGYTMMIAQNGLLYGCGMDSLHAFQPWEGPVLARIDTFRANSPLPCLAASYRLESRIDQNNGASGIPISQDPFFYVSSDGGLIEQVASVAAGGWHTLILSMDGSVAATGEDTYGQLGLGTTNPVYTAGIIDFPSGVTQVVAIAAGLHHSLAIGNDGWLYSWGDDSVGELGIGTAPNQDQPVKVLKVCPPISMSASLTVPNDFLKPYSIKVTIKNTSASLPLTTVDAFLLLGKPLTYGDSMPPDERVSSPISPNGTSSATWDGTLSESVLDSLYPTYFAYIRAAGSAPLLVYVDIVPVIVGPWTICDPANVEDSLTHAPLVGAELVFPGPIPGDAFSGPPFDSNKMVSNEEGMFSLCIHGPIYDRLQMGPIIEYPISLMEENYRTISYYLTEPIPENLTFYLGPSEIQGTFAVPSLPFIGDSIVRVYYPDSLIGYALSRRVIFRTLDSGIHWFAMYEADADLHDVKFRDPAHGWVVGDDGEILGTMDSGETWQINHVGTQNLRALTIIDADTAWAVGDSGTLIKKSGNLWIAQPPLAKDDLTSIHFLDPEDGVIGGNGVYYLYDSGTWGGHTINANIGAAYYTDSGQIYFSGTNGNIINCSGATLSSLTADSTYTTHTINSLYFLNANVGYAAGDSGASFVTYDGGTSWATMAEFPNTVTSMNFFSLAGHGVSDNAVLNYTGEPDTFKSIVRGRLTFGNPPEPILGAEVERWYVVLNDTVTDSGYIDRTFTNEQGNFVFTDIDGIFPYEYHINFMDSGIAKTKIFYAVQGEPHKIITLNYNDYAPPPPDTVLSVGSVSEAVLSLNVSASEFFARISYTIPSDGPMRLIMQDVLGRTVMTIADGFHTQGLSEMDVPLEDLTIGTYYITLETSEGSITKKIIVLR